MNKVLYYLPSILFNTIELIIIYISGICLKIPTYQIIFIFMVFVLIRSTLGGQLHYKDWYRCAVWSILIFISFFLVAKTNFIVSTIIVIFSAVILTTKANIINKAD